MDTNCLVTKLKGSVNNDELKRFGMMTIEVDASQEDSVDSRSLEISIGSAKSSVIKVEGGSFTIDNVTYSDECTITAPADTGLQKIVIFNPGNYKVYIGKYGITRLRFVNNNRELKKYIIDISELNYSDFINFWGLNMRVKGIFSRKNPNMLTREFTYSNEMPGMPSTYDESWIDIESLAQANYISIIGHMMGNINSLNGTTGYLNLRNYGRNVILTGDIKELADSMVSAGKTSGEAIFTLANMNTTLYYDGNLFTNTFVERMGGVGKASGVKFKFKEAAPGYDIEWL